MTKTHSTFPPSPPCAALLFANRWLELTVTEALQGAGIAVDRHSSAGALVSALQLSRANIALIEDHAFHFANGVTTLRFRGVTAVPIVAVGGGSASEISNALLQGASDYAVLGETTQMLVNRVRARLSIGLHSETPTVLQVAGYCLDESSRCLRFTGGHLQLTSREFALAWFLFEHVGRVVNMQTLSQQIWGRDANIAKRTIEQHVSRLRAKLAAACAGASELLNLHAVHGVGYRMVIKRANVQAECDYVGSAMSRVAAT